jgi:sulfite reductase beta subunit-like hemoprotein
MSEVKAIQWVRKDEIQRYGNAFQAFQAGAMDADRFLATRMLQGVYTQRQDGHNMIRAKLPGGRVGVAQLEAIAAIADKFTPGHPVHITTRQDIQFHFVPVDRAAELLGDLGEAGLTTREACGNTIRNIVSCPLAGVCHREHADVTPVLENLAGHYLRHPLTQNLPRKFKATISGCEADCAQGLINDLGIVAVRREGGRLGWKVLAGGGLGHKPHEAIVVEEFVEDADLLAVTEAVISLHNRHSDRSKKAKSRIKFLVDRFGAEGFVGEYRKELARVKSALNGKTLPNTPWTGGERGDAPGAGAPRRVYKQKQPGLFTFPIHVPLGDLTSDQLRKLTAIARKAGVTDIRTTVDQNLLFVSVREVELSDIAEGIAPLGLRIPRAGDNVVACPGTATCTLGLTHSPRLARLLNGGADDLKIRVSGCQNGCAQPEAGDIGLYGEGKRLFDRLVPHYQITLGGTGVGGGGLALFGPAVPAQRVVQAVERIKQDFHASAGRRDGFLAWARQKGAAHFEALLADLVEVKEEEVEALLHDVGNDQVFSVQTGANECAGPRKVNAAPAFTQAAHERAYRDAFLQQGKFGEALEAVEAILLHVGKTLLPVQPAGAAIPVNGVADLAFRVNSPRSPQPQLGARLLPLVQHLGELKVSPKAKDLAALFEDVDAWTADVAEYWIETDAGLYLQPYLPHVNRPAEARAVVKAQRVPLAAL